MIERDAEHMKKTGTIKERERERNIDAYGRQTDTDRFGDGETAIVRDS